MSRESDLKSLKALKAKLGKLASISVALHSTETQIECFQEMIENPGVYKPEGLKAINTAATLESKYKNEWLKKHKEADWLFEDIGGVAFYIVVAFTVIVIILGLFGKSPLSLGNWFAFSIALFIISIICAYIIKGVKNLKHNHPKLTSLQKAGIEEAKKHDEENKKINDDFVKKDKQKYEEVQKKEIEENKKSLEELIATAMKYREDAKKQIKVIKEDECLGEKDKNIAIVDQLIEFIETKRADSIKEALHELDKMSISREQLILEKEKIRLEQEKVAQEQADRQIQLDSQRRHQEAVESQMRQDTAIKQKIAQDTEQIGRDIYYGTWYDTKK